MRRLVTVLIVTALAGVAIAAWGAVASARDAGPTQAKAKLPPLPANIKERKRWQIGRASCRERV